MEGKFKKYKVRESEYKSCILLEATSVELKDGGIVFYVGKDVEAIFPLGTTVEMVKDKE